MNSDNLVLCIPTHSEPVTSSEKKSGSTFAIFFQENRQIENPIYTLNSSSVMYHCRTTFLHLPVPKKQVHKSFKTILSKEPSPINSTKKVIRFTHRRSHQYQLTDSSILLDLQNMKPKLKWAHGSFHLMLLGNNHSYTNYAKSETPAAVQLILRKRMLLLAIKSSW